MDQLKFHTDRLRVSGLRPTKQRLAICKVLFNRKETFHFTIDQLKKIVERNGKKKISLATLYNTVHAFEKKGYLKEIALKAISKKTGARGLRSILESILLKTMFDLPSQDNVQEVIIEANTVKGQSQPILVHSKTEKSKTEKTTAA